MMQTMTTTTTDSQSQSESLIDSSNDRRAYDVLALVYLSLALIALVQFVRIQRRASQKSGLLIFFVCQTGWTTQKSFVILNFLVMFMRSLVFFLRENVSSIQPLVYQSVLLDFPGLLFFTTYSLLILFWSQIYEQATTVSTDTNVSERCNTFSLRFKFFSVNIIVYISQIICWVGEYHQSKNYKKWHFAAAIIRLIAFLFASIGFATYGGLLFFMLRKFPNDAPGKAKKLFEIGICTASCTLCFTFRAACILMSSINSRKFPLDVLQSTELNVVYYLLSEIAPSAMVLFALRKLPPAQRQRVRGGNNNNNRNLDDDFTSSEDEDDESEFNEDEEALLEQIEGDDEEYEDE